MVNNTVEIAYFGAAVFKITTGDGKKILIDPYIKNPLCRQNLEYFCDADLIIVSHGAFDHMGDTVDLMKKSKAVLICGTDVESYCRQMGIPKERFKMTVYGVEHEYKGIKVKTVEAKHMSRVVTNEGHIFAQGSPMGFVITTEAGIKIYHTGDTSIFGDLRMIGMLYKPNILLIGISSIIQEIPPEISINEAALATLWVAPDIVIPMHYPPGSKAPLEFQEAINKFVPNVRSVLVEPNSHITYTKYQISNSQ